MTYQAQESNQPSWDAKDFFINIWDAVSNFFSWLLSFIPIINFLSNSPEIESDDILTGNLTWSEMPIAQKLHTVPVEKPIAQKLHTTPVEKGQDLLSLPLSLTRPKYRTDDNGNIVEAQHVDFNSVREDYLALPIVGEPINLTTQNDDTAKRNVRDFIEDFSFFSELFDGKLQPRKKNIFGDNDENEQNSWLLCPK